MSSNVTCVCKVCGTVRSFKKPNHVCSAKCRAAYKAMLATQEAATTQSNPSAILKGAKHNDTHNTKD
jgi:hypothetical protein